MQLIDLTNPAHIFLIWFVALLIFVIAAAAWDTLRRHP